MEIRDRIKDSKLRIKKIPVEKIHAAAYNPRKDLKPGDPEGVDNYGMRLVEMAAP